MLGRTYVTSMMGSVTWGFGGMRETGGTVAATCFVQTVEQWQEEENEG